MNEQVSTETNRKKREQRRPVRIEDYETNLLEVATNNELTTLLEAVKRADKDKW